ncbi:response regulator [Erythrobacter donghaensis]|uniref:response regulator n=1 Tax=Erythrobacter donghaensis TaxID=267135 RepID=UPI000A380D88|nr:response regulator [Erythrobacter donghaensis]
MSQPILIIEDEFLIAFEMQRTLKQQGYPVIGIAVDLESAMAFAQRGEIALALVDLNLRDGLTGPQIGTCLARDYSATVIFVTGNERELGDGIEGTIGVLGKPADSTDLLSVVDFGLKRRRGEKCAPPSCLRCFS